MRLLPMLLLTGCATGSLTINVYQEYCSDWDPDSNTSEMVIEAQGVDTLIYRTNGVARTGSLFDPEIIVEGGTIFLHEYWDDTEADITETCYHPGILLTDPPSRSWTIEWYDEDAAVPWFREKFKP